MGLAVEELTLDQTAVQIARSRGAIDLALGEALARLFGSGKLIQLGYALLVAGHPNPATDAYGNVESLILRMTRERLGVPPRTMYGWIALAAAVAGRQLLRRAVLDGSVTPRSVVGPTAYAVGAGALRRGCR